MESPVASGTEWVEEAVRLYERRMIRYARSLTHNLERARDAVQETFLELTRCAPSVDRSRVVPWLFAVCRRRSIDLARRETRRAHGTEEDLARRASPAPPPDLAAEADEEAAEALRLVGSLPPREQEVVRLRFQEGLRNVEIAEVLGITANHVGVLLHAALSKLREGMTPDPEPLTATEAIR